MSTKKAAARQQLHEMEVLLELARRISTIESLDELLETIVAMTAKETGSDRGTLFLHDDATGQLYSRVAQGTKYREIRVLSHAGIAGHVFTSGEGLIVHDAYSYPKFDRSIDDETGYKTRNVMCAPIRTGKGDVVGVLQMLNKHEGEFTETDLTLLEAMTRQTAITLRNHQFIEHMKVSRQQEMRFLDILADITSDFDLSVMLQKIVREAAAMLRADRATLFLNDAKKNELFSRVAMGDSVGEIRMPNHLGIAGAVFTSGQTINIPHAYADLRFNPAFDKRTGYFTRSILCVPITNKSGKNIGVTQVLNKRGGPFTADDETRLKAFTAQLAISLENAKLFDDVQNMKNYNDSMLQSMSNGVVTLNEDGKIVTCNAAGLRIFRAALEEMVGHPVAEYFKDGNAWVIEKIKHVEATQTAEISMDRKLTFGGDEISVNLTALPLVGQDDHGRPKKLGALLMIEDISTEKRMKSTMSRYMDSAVADQLLAQGDEVLGGKNVPATVVFTDLRNFTGISEELGAQGVVSLLNEYFTVMVECISKQGGMLDKFIGDAIMAVFGIPLPHEDDEDRAVRAAISMIRELNLWNAGRIENGKRTVDMGVGLNTDIVVSGNIGSPKRMDYTIIGDGVNLASRLEGACKQYAAHILASANTVNKLRGTYRMREVDLLTVKGKTEPVPVFEILDYHTEETFPNMLDALNQFKGGLGFYRKGQWDKAIDTFRAAADLNPKDKLPGIYIDRCVHLKENPPEGEWTGVWVMKTK